METVGDSAEEAAKKVSYRNYSTSTIGQASQQVNSSSPTNHDGNEKKEETAKKTVQTVLRQRTGAKKNRVFTIPTEYDVELGIGDAVWNVKKELENTTKDSSFNSPLKENEYDSKIVIKKEPVSPVRNNTPVLKRKKSFNAGLNSSAGVFDSASPVFQKTMTKKHSIASGLNSLLDHELLLLTSPTSTGPKPALSGETSRLSVSLEFDYEGDEEDC